MPTNAMYINENTFKKMQYIKFSGAVKNKRTTESRLEEQTKYQLTRRNYPVGWGGAVEYTDSFSAVVWAAPQTSILDMTLKNLMVRFE